MGFDAARNTYADFTEAAMTDLPEPKPEPRLAPELG
jgi:hypothetical protein